MTDDIERHTAAAFEALWAYVQATRPNGTREEVAGDQEALQDLLCGLRHLAAREGMDYVQADTRAYDHFRHEINEHTLNGELITALINSDDPQVCIRVDYDGTAHLSEGADEWSLRSPLVTRDQAREQILEFDGDAEAYAASLQIP